MKTYAPQDIRNVALVSHQAAGKTMLAEAILFHTGALGRMGSVDDGNSNLDYHANEIERKTSIYAALGGCEHEGTKFNLLDTPGFEDFRGDLIASLEVVESVVLLVRADAGVEVGTDSIWSMLEEKGMPAIFAVSKMDKEHANFGDCMSQIKERLTDKAIPVQLPIGHGDSFRGLVDVVAGKAFLYDKPGEPQEVDIPDELKGAYEEAREDLLNAAAEHDDALVEKFLEEGDLTYEEIVQGIRIGVKDRTFFPVCVASATNGIGIRPVLHSIKEYLPSAADVTSIRGLQGDEEVEVPVGAEQPLVVRAFKLSMERDAGDFVYLRVFSGAIQAGEEVFNANRNHGERITQLFNIEGKNRDKIERIGSGDFGAAVKLKDTHVGDTLGASGSETVLPPIPFPEPSSRVAVRPVKQGEDDKVAQGMHRLNEEDPTFRFYLDPETHEQVLEGQGELHMDVLAEKLARRYKTEVSRHEPRIPYREALKSTVEVAARHKKQTGGRGQFADVNIRFEPLPRGGGFEFVNAVVGGAIPSKFIPAVEKGLVETMARGTLAGYNVVDLKATLFDGGFHPVDSSEQAFKTAAFSAMKEAFQKAKAVLLEPICTVEVKCPEDVMGDVMGDLSSRRGRILGTESVGHFQVVRASVPLAELYRYSTSLRSMTQGRGTHTRDFDRYEEVPADLMGKIIEKAKADAEEA